MNNKISPLALSLIVLGFVLFLKLVGEVTAPYPNIYGNMLLFYGITAVFMNMGTQRKGALFIGVLGFMVGVLLYITNHFDIMSTNRLIIPSLFFILGSGFLFLFFDDFAEKIFLYIALVLFLSGYLTITLYDTFGWMRFSASIGRVILSQWEYLSVIVGIGILTDRKT